MVYADHTVQSERTEVFQKLNLIKDFRLQASLNKRMITKTCCKKRHEKLQHSKHKKEESEIFNQKMKRNFITNKICRKILPTLHYTQEVGNGHFKVIQCQYQ